MTSEVEFDTGGATPHPHLIEELQDALAAADRVNGVLIRLLSEVWAELFAQLGPGQSIECLDELREVLQRQGLWRSIYDE